MTQSDREDDPDLADVKAVLRRLQKLAPEERRASEAKGLSELRRVPPAAADTLSQPPARAVPEFPPMPALVPPSEPVPAEPVDRDATTGHRGRALLFAAVLLTGSSAAALLLSPVGEPLTRALTALARGDTGAGPPPAAPPAPPDAGRVTTAGADLKPAAVAELETDAARSSAPSATDVPPSPPVDAIPEALPPTALATEQPVDRSSVGEAAVEAALRGAREALADGRVNAARANLLQMIDLDSAEVAWTLARSYDPNVLSTISNADAAPDPIEAEFWYRVWHARAIFHGQVPSTVSIDRLIRSLR